MDGIGFKESLMNSDKRRNELFCKKLSRYPRMTAWEIQTVPDLISYEASNGRTCEIEAEKEILDAIEEYRPAY